MKSTAILYIRYRQASRLLSELPLLYRIVIFVFLGISGIVTAQFMSKSLENALGVTGFAVFMAVSLHYTRSDKEWIIMHTEKPWQVYWAEYLSLTAIFWLPILFSPYFYLMPAIALLLLGLTLLPYRAKSASQWVSNWLPLPTALFEWKAGMRQMRYAPLLIYMLGFISCYWPYASIGLLWLLQSIMLSFYQWHEPRELLEQSGNNARDFLRKKIILHTKAWAVAIAPILLLSLILHIETWLLLVVYAIFSLYMQVFFILGKYALYEPNTKLEGNQVIMGLAIYSLLIPFLLPIPFIMGIRYYRMAIRNLNFYWDA